MAQQPDADDFMARHEGEESESMALEEDSEMGGSSSDASRVLEWSFVKAPRVDCALPASRDYRLLAPQWWKTAHCG